MVPRKSQVDFYVNLCSSLIACDPLCADRTKSIARDIETVQSRTAFEGLSFLTKTLPKLGKALDQGLIRSCFVLPREFPSSSDSQNIPAFMQGYFKQVFDSNGYLLEEAEPLAVLHLRQVCFFAYKLELPYSKAEERDVIDSFVQSESELEFDQNEKNNNEILNVASFISETIFKDFDPMDIVPRHGPGAVATGEYLEEKWEFSRLYDSIHQVYPYYNYYIIGGARELVDRLEWYKQLERHHNGVAKVILVPKDSRGPRLISSEPLEYQWIQQGLGRKLSSHLESFWMTKGQVNFTDQSINQRLALESSISQEYATIDMKEASDRVSLNLVRRVFERTPLLLRCLEACRSTATTLPDGSVLPLSKFAPMGSALCFPVEAFCFWVICVAAVSRELKLRQALVGQKIFIYGDDIIVPTEWASLCMSSLERFALVVNRSKSCTTGNFRESCGIDAFKGVVVTPIRLKTLWSGQSTDGSAYASYIAFANKIAPWYPEASEFVWSNVELVYGVIPHGTVLASYPCRIVRDAEQAEHYNAMSFPHRYSRRYQRSEFRLLVLSSRREKSKLDSWHRLLRNIVSGSGDDPSSVVYPRSMSIKRGWRSVY